MSARWASGEPKPQTDRADQSRRPAANEGSAYWRRLLGGEDRRLERLRRLFAKLPDAPRCKICNAPFAGWGNLVSGSIGRQRASKEMTLCRNCHARIVQHQGSTEVDATVVIVDFRGGGAPGSVSENAHFSRLVGRVIDRHGGVLEKIDANHLRAFFAAWCGGENHVECAIGACRDLFAVANDDPSRTRWIGVGLHTGRVRVGTVTDGDHVDFGAVGPTVNVTTKLAAAATTGEALVSLAAWRHHGGPVARSRRRSIPIPGELRPIDAIVVRGDIEAKL